ncbi:MAG: hypothetical protein KAI47_24215 [Deltaproteobacteria bacterium]|nr:hypothetical protein [Deltaproteobacteria bacterium]
MTDKTDRDLGDRAMEAVARDEVESGIKPTDASSWRRLGAAMGRAASATGRGLSVAASATGRGLSVAASTTGRGLSVAAQVAAKNRHYVLPVLNGFVGDQLVREAPDAGGAAIQMRFREGGEDVGVADLDLGARLVGPGRRVLVVIPGLMCDEVIFQDPPGGAPDSSPEGIGDRIARERGATVLYVRYNTGRHISENGQILSELLGELFEAYGEAIDDLVLLGHSMGGLVIRSAGYYGRLRRRPWVDKLSTVLLLGVPLRGSFVEQLANVTAFVLGRVGNLYTRMGAWIIEERSDGIKDLRFGLMVDEDWASRPKDERLFVTKTAVPPLPGVAYHVVGGTLARDDGSWLSLLFGDGLIGPKSAGGDRLFRPDDPVHPCGSVRFFPGKGHLEILASPEVGDYIVSLLPSVSSGG